MLWLNCFSAEILKNLLARIQTQNKNYFRKKKKSFHPFHFHPDLPLAHKADLDGSAGPADAVRRIWDLRDAAHPAPLQQHCWGCRSFCTKAEGNAPHSATISSHRLFRLMRATLRAWETFINKTLSFNKSGCQTNGVSFTPIWMQIKCLTQEIFVISHFLHAEESSAFYLLTV